MDRVYGLAVASPKKLGYLSILSDRPQSGGSGSSTLVNLLKRVGKVLLIRGSAERLCGYLLTPCHNAGYRILRPIISVMLSSMDIVDRPPKSREMQDFPLVSRYFELNRPMSKPVVFINQAGVGQTHARAVQVERPLAAAFVNMAERGELWPHPADGFQ